MSADPPKPNRKGRWSSESILNALDRQYALVRGCYETIEQKAEGAVGLSELIEMQDWIESEKVLMKRVLDAIEVVARHVDPTWTPGRVRPIYSRRRTGRAGEVSRTAANIMRREQRPMTVREVAKATAAALGRPSEEREIARLDLAIRSSFDRKVGKSLGIIQGTPRRYFILEAPSAGVLT